MSDEILTYAQIKRRYNGEWVIVADCETDEQLNVLRGRVVAHSKSRDDVYDQVLGIKPRPKNMATLCFVPVPKDTVFLL